MRRRVVYMVMFIKNLSLTQRDCDRHRLLRIFNRIN